MANQTALIEATISSSPRGFWKEYDDAARKCELAGTHHTTGARRIELVSEAIAIVSWMLGAAVSQEHLDACKTVEADIASIVRIMKTGR